MCEVVNMSIGRDYEKALDCLEGVRYFLYTVQSMVNAIAVCERHGVNPTGRGGVNYVLLCEHIDSIIDEYASDLDQEEDYFKERKEALGGAV